MSKKTVLITGVAGGMGKAQAETFLNKDYQVIGLDVDPSALADIEEEFKNNDGEFQTYEVDISNKNEIDEALEDIKEKVDSIDVLVNTAGIFDKYQPFLEMDIDTWDAVFDVNIRGMFLLSQAVVGKMVEQESDGVIINVASAAGLRQDGGGAAYTASKHAVVGLTKKMSYELGEKGVRVNAIAPGRISTEMNENTDDLIKSDLPAQRNGTTEDISELTLFLASDKSDYIHGQIISIDGGWTVL